MLTRNGEALFRAAYALRLTQDMDKAAERFDRYKEVYLKNNLAPVTARKEAWDILEAWDCLTPEEKNISSKNR